VAPAVVAAMAAVSLSVEVAVAVVEGVAVAAWSGRSRLRSQMEVVAVMMEVLVAYPDLPKMVAVACTLPRC
jgi:hypothetical protein